MDIMQIVNWMQRESYPNGTIHKWALNQLALPNGIPFMGGFVELFPGATLPLTVDVQANQTPYETAMGVQVANAGIKRQIAALEAQQTPRRMREAIADPTWLNGLNDQINALRSQIQ